MALRASAVFQRWDRSTDAGSRGAVLFARWFDKLTPDMFSQPWTANDPIETPAGLKDAKGAVNLLAQAALEVIRDYDSLNIAWGDVYRFRLGQADYPANGDPKQYGIYRTIYYTKKEGHRYRAVAGDSYVAIIEFSRHVRANVLLSYGNASQQGSRHIADQLDLLSHKALRDVLLLREEILQHVEEDEKF
jgi:acyl-homoserine-lactone acylase